VIVTVLPSAMPTFHNHRSYEGIVALDLPNDL